MTRDFQSIIQSYRNGDHITMEELVVLRDKAKSLSDLCWLFGDVLLLPRLYALEIEGNCSRYINARLESQRKAKADV